MRILGVGGGSWEEGGEGGPHGDKDGEGWGRIRVKKQRFWPNGTHHIAAGTNSRGEPGREVPSSPLLREDSKKVWGWGRSLPHGHHRAPEGRGRARKGPPPPPPPLQFGSIPTLNGASDGGDPTLSPCNPRVGNGPHSPSQNPFPPIRMGSLQQGPIPAH